MTSDGTVPMVDFKSFSNAEENARKASALLSYGISVMHCMMSRLSKEAPDSAP